MDAVLVAIVDKEFIILVKMFALAVVTGAHSVIMEFVDVKRDTIHIKGHA